GGEGLACVCGERGHREEQGGSREDAGGEGEGDRGEHLDASFAAKPDRAEVGGRPQGPPSFHRTAGSGATTTRSPQVMFEKLRGAFSSLAKAVSEKKLSEKDLDDTLYDFQLALMESDVAQSIVEKVTGDLKRQLLGMSVERSKDMQELVKEKLRSEVLSVFSQAGDVDVLERIKGKKATGEPFKILFLGINGTGKTTTVAKFANFLKKAGFSVVIAAGDTHRAGAIEQVTEHANRIGAKV